MEEPGAEVDPRSLPKTADGLREAWSIVERTWGATFNRARQLPEAALHESVNGEWSFIETQRHLLFATDVWIRRSVLDDPAAYHRLGMPPDLRTGRPDPDDDVSQWGIDVSATTSLTEVLETRAEYMRLVRDVIASLTADELNSASAHNPPWVPQTTVLPMSFCLDVVIGEEWAHHQFATRDLAIVEGRL